MFTRSSCTRAYGPYVSQVLGRIMSVNLRPPVADLTCSVPEWIRALLPLCWARLQEDRPSAAAICEVFSLESVYFKSTVKLLFCLIILYVNAVLKIIFL